MAGEGKEGREGRGEREGEARQLAPPPKHKNLTPPMTATYRERNNFLQALWNIKFTHIRLLREISDGPFHLRQDVHNGTLLSKRLV
jgi:hypothetical protein